MAQLLPWAIMVSAAVSVVWEWLEETKTFQRVTEY